MQSAGCGAPENDKVACMTVEAQKTLCMNFGADYVPFDAALKIGISRDFHSRTFPINGLRHPPIGDTSGRYIWSGERYSEDPGFFVAIHAAHIADRCSEAAKYLGLGPGWRFLFAPRYEDVWFDQSLLNTQRPS